jgi:hypothetical protein
VLRDLEAALLALPAKRLIANHLAKDGEVSAVGALIAHRKASWLGREREEILRELQDDREPDEWGEFEDDGGETVDAGVAVGVPEVLAWRIVGLNDQDLDYCTPDQRYEKVLSWTRKHLGRPHPLSSSGGATRND